MRLCCHPTCQEPTKTGQLMCRSHWFGLPKPLRDAIWATWRSKDRVSWLKNVREAERFYEEKVLP